MGQNKKSEPRAFQIEAECEIELLELLLAKSAGQSRTTVKSWLAHRQVSVNGQIVTLHSTPVAKGDTVRISHGRGPEAFSHPMMRIVFEDDHIIVIDKRNGLLSMGTDKERARTAHYILSQHVKRSDPSSRIFIVHRLDRETSGLMLLAKSERVQEKLQKNWRDLVRLRRYVAVAEGGIKPDEGIIDAPLADNKARKVYVCGEGDGWQAVTRYRVLGRGAGNTLVELELETGRKNQIRAHLSHIGHPVAGDIKYGGHECRAGRVCLHAYKLHITHPVTGEQLDFSTRIPQIFESLAR